MHACFMCRVRKSAVHNMRCRTRAVAREHGNAILLFLPLSASYALAGLLAIALPDRCEGSESTAASGKGTGTSGNVPDATAGASEAPRDSVAVALAEGESEDVAALTAHDGLARAEDSESSKDRS